MSKGMSETTAKETLLAKLQSEIDWQRRWEKKYRRVYYALHWTSWASGFLILLLAFYQLRLGDDYKKWIILCITALSMLSVTLPVLSGKLKFQQRQEVYDRMARQYDLIHTKLQMGVMSVEDALSEFERIHSQPTEKVIRDTV